MQQSIDQRRGAAARGFWRCCARGGECCAPNRRPRFRSPWAGAARALCFGLASACVLPTCFSPFPPRGVVGAAQGDGSGCPGFRRRKAKRSSQSVCAPVSLLLILDPRIFGAFARRAPVFLFPLPRRICLPSSTPRWFRPRSLSAWRPVCAVESRGAWFFRALFILASLAPWFLAKPLSLAGMAASPFHSYACARVGASARRYARGFPRRARFPSGRLFSPVCEHWGGAPLSGPTKPGRIGALGLLRRGRAQDCAPVSVLQRRRRRAAFMGRV